MRIIALEREPSSVLGGQELNLVEICSSLAKRGHQINLVYTNEGDLLDNYQKFCNSLVKISRYAPQRKRLTEILDFVKDIAKNVRKIPVSQDSIIFCNDFSSVFFGSILSAFRGVPLIHYMQLPGYEFKIKWRPGLDAVNQFIAVSNQTKDSWVKLGVPEKKVNVVYNGIDTEKFNLSENFLAERSTLGISEQETIVLYVGRLNRDKGIEVLLRAFALVLQNGVNARLLVAGNPVLGPEEDSPEARDKYKRYLEQLATDLDIRKHVSFLGHVANTKALYQASDITVVPSTWNEPFGRVIIESMACGTPAICSRIGGIVEIVKPFKENWLVEPGNETELMNALMQIKDWRGKEPELRQDCRNHVVNNFSSEKMINGIEKVLLNVIEKCH
ncbi:MAG: glycosyltransferase family 4 protein [Calothrix sp. SM1_7_51]|nr:glycosyltransferase family 4 protein [Calothrix sp. SM1_7_51]